MIDRERQRIINQAARILGDINQYFTDVEYWNNSTRPRLYPDAAPIDPDPTGEMQKWKRGLQEELKAEALLGNFPTVI